MEQNDKSHRWSSRDWIKLVVIIVIIGLVIDLVFIIYLFRPGPRDYPIKLAPEASAVMALRIIRTSQELYFDRNSTYGTFAQLGPTGMIDSVLASATTPASAKTGYYFTLRVSRETWCCGARPAEWGVSGKRSYRISQDGVIYDSDKDEDLTLTTSR